MNAPDDGFSLERTPLRPERVVRTLRVQSPGAILGGDGSATLRCDLGEAEMVVDFGRERVGYVTLFAGSDAAARLSISYGESEEELELSADLSRELPWYHFPRDEFLVGAGRQEFRSTGRRAFRFMRLRAARCVSPISVGDMTVLHQHAPVRRRGHFSCSDPLLNRIWDISSYTTELCMQGYYEDGIKRDGLLWIGDARVQFLCAYHAFGDTALAETSLRMMAASQRDDGALPSCAAIGGGHQHPHVIEYMPDVAAGVGRWIIDNYCTDFLSALKEYHDHTGNTDMLRDLWPCALRTAGYLAGLPLDPPIEKNIITDENIRAKDSWWPSVGTFLMQLHAAWRDMAACAAVVSDEAEHDRCRARMRDVAKRIAAGYRSEAAGVFTDRPAAAGQPPEVSWHANAFAVLGGVAPADPRAFAQVAAFPDAAYPIAGFMKFWVLKAMMDCRMMHQAVQDIREYWGFMLAHDATTCWEKLDLRRPDNVLGNPLVSRCHGWSAGPCVLFPRYLLGVLPDGPGFSRIAVSPFLPDGVSWMEGTIPTPHGEIFVRWDRTDGGLDGCISVPPGVSGRAGIDGQGIPLHRGANSLRIEGPCS